ncbi:hypothetical protein K2173_010332 [Erythroxylum novogranatense]|uniref:Uncharacterized protein n=1 Tax=Erythroxylum novogranatense TaxID=1862640 RepID=A0AAV8TDK8_9ROSI|nr:hypothetical protein K2173_010332 [Erythroxylum novogranatense]
MEIQVEQLSRNIIKPSSQTPNHLRHCQFSSLDQIMVQLFSPSLLFYDGNSNITNKERCEKLKKSLSETLTLFYPFAGRVIGNSHIECNDEGVPFVEAKAKGTLLELLHNPYCNHLNKLLPFEVTEPSDLVAFVQVTYFDCGGIAIGVGTSHKIADALSVATFQNTWAAIARGDSNINVPRFEAARYFSPINTSEFDPCFELLNGENNMIVSQRFLFKASSVAALRDNYAKGNSIGHQPTRIESLTAFLCRRIIASSQETAKGDGVYIVKHALNLRSRMNPPLPNHYIGNYVYEPAVAVVDVKMNVDDACYSVSNQMREAIRKVDTEFVKILQDGEEHLKMMKERAEAQGSGKVTSISFSSCCRLPFYETDFGWGKPAWSGLGSLPYKNLVMLYDAKEQGDIVANIYLEKEDMTRFEKDHELAAHVSPINPGSEI